MNFVTYQKLFQDDPVHQKLCKAFGYDENLNCLNPPICVFCNDDSAWKSLFEREGIEYTELDAPKVTYRDLKGMTRAPHAGPMVLTPFEPDWLKDAKRTHLIVLNNLELVPYETDDVLENPSKYLMCEDLYLEHRPEKVAFEYLLMLPHEFPRKLSIFSEIIVPENIFTILIVKNAKQIPYFTWSKLPTRVDL